MQNSARLAELIEKMEAGTASAAEIAELNEWYHSFDDSQAQVNSTDPESATESAMGERIRRRLLETIRQAEKQPALYRRLWFRSAAAAVLLMAIAGAYLLLRNPSGKPAIAEKPLTPKQELIVPGGNKAQLILADGSTIILDSASNGVLSTQGKINVQKLDNGLLAYTLNGQTITDNDEAFYNTIRTPRGGQYQVTLADGTKVWLNAASSIRFPVYFTGRERRVEITGEAYFEVAKNPEQPFHVKAENSEVEVLGTHFNINAYTDEASIKTTLLEGKVKVTSSTAPARYLDPGQQSGISKSGDIRIFEHADTDEAVAWLKGRFQFNSADLHSILRQISRWYDVDVEYRGPVDLHFSGQLTRNEEVKNVFEKLQMTGEVHFKVEGRKVIVTR